MKSALTFSISDRVKTKMASHIESLRPSTLAYEIGQTRHWHELTAIKDRALLQFLEEPLLAEVWNLQLELITLSAEGRPFKRRALRDRLIGEIASK